MGTLANKRILLAVTGGIAAYKSADLARRLRDADAEVRVVMTRAATDFITPLTLQAVSGQPVHTEMVSAESRTGMEHIELARWADAVLVAPASADFIARLAQGRANDLLGAVCLATAAPVAVAPAMNQQMWLNPATQSNLLTLAPPCYPCLRSGRWLTGLWRCRPRAHARADGTCRAHCATVRNR